MEDLKEFIEDTGGKYLQILDKNGEQVTAHNSANNADLVESFETEYKHLKPGFYKLRMSESKTSHGSGVKVKSFRKVGESNETQNNSSKGMTAEQIDTMLKQAREEGYRAAKMEELDSRLSKIEAWIEKATPILAEMKDQLDGDEDGDFITKTASALGKAVEIKDSLQGFKF
jgi:hypothetical protein